MNQAQKTIIAIGVAVALLFAAVQFHQEGNLIDNGQTAKPTKPRTKGEIAVVVLRETKTERSLPISQQVIFTAKPIRDYLDEHCLKLNGSPARYFIDNDTKYDKSNDLLRELMESDRVKKLTDADMPYVFISNGYTDGIEGPLPESVPEFLSLLQDWGGP